MTARRGSPGPGGCGPAVGAPGSGRRPRPPQESCPSVSPVSGARCGLRARCRHAELGRWLAGQAFVCLGSWPAPCPPQTAAPASGLLWTLLGKDLMSAVDLLPGTRRGDRQVLGGRLLETSVGLEPPRVGDGVAWPLPSVRGRELSGAGRRGRCCGLGPGCADGEEAARGVRPGAALGRAGPSWGRPGAVLGPCWAGLGQAGPETSSSESCVFST